MSKEVPPPYKGKTVLGTEWRTTTTRSDDNINYEHTALLPRVVKPYEGKYGKTWELKAPLRAAGWKQKMDNIDWPSERVIHNGRLKEGSISSLDCDLSQCSVQSLTPSLYHDRDTTTPIIPLHKKTLKVPKLSFHDFERFAAELSDNNTVHTLNLSNNALGDLGAKYFALALHTNQHLEHLVLWGNTIGDAGAKDFAKALSINTTLKSLQLGHNRITSEGAMSIFIDGLCNNSTLEGLFMEGNLIDDCIEGAFSEMLNVNSGLKKLNLRHNDLGKLSGIDIGKGLEVNTTLQALYLENNKLGDKGALAIATALEKNETNAVHSCHMNKNGLSKVGHQAVKAKKATKILEEEARFQAVLDNLEQHK
jgi:hypothetical protein